MNINILEKDFLIQLYNVFKDRSNMASAGVGQGAKATMTKPLKPEDYDKSALKRPGSQSSDT